MVRALALLWIFTCNVYTLDMGLANIAARNIMLRNYVNAIDISDINTECIYGDLSYDCSGVDYEDMHLNVTQLIAKYNYPVEEHYVTTTDGYILTIIRMPNDGPIVYLMHGFLSSSDEFVTTNLPNSIAYNLWLDGFEIWIGNARGNKYSRRHVTLDPNTDGEFWNFSWDEIGRIDLTNIIDYILEKTGQSQIFYIGHSQGTTSYYVMCSEIPEYNDKITLMISLSAVAYLPHLKSPVIRLLAPFSKDIQLLSQLIGYGEFLPSSFFIKTLTSLFCSKPSLASLICANIVSLLFGFDCAQVNTCTAPITYGHLPSGSSTKQLIHYLQEIQSGKFRKYDHGARKNYEIYGTTVPPDYDVGKITSPVAIFHSDNDRISNFIDVQVLINQLPNVIEIYRVPFDKFGHVDYLFAKDLKTLVYTKVHELVRTFSGKMQH